MNILLVDDSKLIHAMVVQTLEMTGIELNQIHHAMNGMEGLQVLCSNPIDLIFSDIHMPIMDGVEMIRRIRKESSIQNIPVVVISSEGSQKRIDELNQLGVTHFIRKPFTPEAINEVIQEVMGSQNG